MQGTNRFGYVLFIPLILLTSGCKDQQDTITATNSPLTESVYSSIIIQPENAYEVYASVNGILDQIMVEEGSLVSRGTIMFKIKNTAPQLNVQNARVNLEQAKLNAGRNSAILGTIVDEISTAQLNLKNAKENWERQKNLWQQEIGTKAEYDSRKLAYESAQNQLNMLQNKYERAKSELNTALEQAKINLSSANTNATDFTIRSQINGKMYTINKEQGEIVTPQTPISTVGAATDFIIEMLIDEVDITKIQIGQEVIITLDAYGNQTFIANITKIYPAKNERTQTFKIEGLFVEKPNRLYPGLTGEANIIIAKKAKTLSLPKEYVNDQNEVNTTEGLIKVKTGLQSMDRIEILSGIDSTTKILKHKE